MTAREHLAAALQVLAQRYGVAGSERALVLADELIAALAGKVTLVNKAEHDRLVADAQRMRRIRKSIDEYHALLPPERRAAQESRLSPYERWAKENMGPR